MPMTTDPALVTQPTLNTGNPMQDDEAFDDAIDEVSGTGEWVLLDPGPFDNTGTQTPLACTGQQQ
jgi:hypothetical protein